MESLNKLSVCPRCDRYTSPMHSMGRWECSYHPGEYIVDEGYSCCGKKVRALRYNPTSVLLGQSEHYVRPPRGCTPCDCGNDLADIHIEDIAHVVDQIDIDKWKGFRYPILYRSEFAFNRAPL